MSKKVGVIDYGAGNLFSVDNAIKGLVRDRFVSSDPEELMNADYIIFPGVGSFSDGMKGMKKYGLDEFLKNYVASGKPVLGICLGMQMMLTEGYEGGGVHQGLGLLEGTVHKLTHINNSRIPHMGWNDVYGNDMIDIPIFKDIELKSSYYFVHSYHVTLSEEVKKVYTDFYGIDIVSGFQKDNLFATQFHPEKSQSLGVKLLKNFLNIGRS